MSSASRFSSAPAAAHGVGRLSRWRSGGADPRHRGGDGRDGGKAARRRADDPSDPSSGLLSLQPHQGEQRVRGGVTHPIAVTDLDGRSAASTDRPRRTANEIGDWRRLASIWPSGPDNAKQDRNGGTSDEPGRHPTGTTASADRLSRTRCRGHAAGPASAIRRHPMDNRQLLWHMVFGYLIVRTLMPPVHLLGRLGWSRRCAAILDALHRPFHLINYAGSAGGGCYCHPGGWPQSWTRRSTFSTVGSPRKRPRRSRSRCTSRLAGTLLLVHHKPVRRLPLRHRAPQPSPPPAHLHVS